MKVVILCGGLGTRLREETEYRPKPMVPIGGRPILWHIMNRYAAYGVKEFILCLGYKGEMVKDYFLHYRTKTTDFTLKLGTEGQDAIQYHSPSHECDWTITFADTGEQAMTGARASVYAIMPATAVPQTPNRNPGVHPPGRRPRIDAMTFPAAERYPTARSPERSATTAHPHDLVPMK